MTVLKQALDQLQHHLPGFAKQINDLPFSERERSESEVVKLFKQAGGAGLLVGSQYKGRGLNPWQAVLTQIALGSLSPSLSIAVGMHQFSVATLGELAKQGRGMESLLLEAIAKNDLLVSSVFSEGFSANSIMSSKIVATPHKKGFLISGVKKPCSLAFDMDLMTASVRVEPEEGAPYLAVALIHSQEQGLTVEKFWQAPFLQGSQSEAVVLNEVYVPHSMLVNIDESQAYIAHVNGFIWFELLTLASYLGMVYGLLDYADKLNRLHGLTKSSLYSQIETLAMATKAIAQEMDSEVSPSLLADILNVRFGAQPVLLDVVNKIIACIGGINYISDPYPSTIVQCIQALSFHPPGQFAISESLNQWVDSGELNMV